jgi:hypothetical protein
LRSASPCCRDRSPAWTRSEEQTPKSEFSEGAGVGRARNIVPHTSPEQYTFWVTLDTMQLKGESNLTAFEDKATLIALAGHTSSVRRRSPCRISCHII